MMTSPTQGAMYEQPKPRESDAYRERFNRVRPASLAEAAILASIATGTRSRFSSAEGNPRTRFKQRPRVSR